MYGMLIKHTQFITFYLIIVSSWTWIDQPICEKLRLSSGAIWLVLANEQIGVRQFFNEDKYVFSLTYMCW